MMNSTTSGYETIRGSDMRRGGVYIELIEHSTGDEVAEIFYAAETREMTITIFKNDLPLEAVEMLIDRAKRDLPPVSAA